jgi:alpha-glucosidase
MRPLLLLLVILAPLLAEDVVTVKSPDGRIEFRLFNGPPTNPDFQLTQLSYQVDFNGKRLLDTSALGFTHFEQIPLGQKLSVTHEFRDQVDETFTMPAGKASTVRNRYNEVIAQYLQDGSTGRRMTMEVRAFNDGVAFRYAVPPTPLQPGMRIENEVTQYTFAKDGPAYAMLARNFQTGYEEQYTRIPLTGIQPQAHVALPLLAEQPGVGWAAITEAAVEDYSAAYLVHLGGGVFETRLSPRVDGSLLAVIVPNPMVTPWRVILIGDRPEKLIESNIVDSLNEPGPVKDTSWIKPGKVVQAAATTAAVERAIDFAAESGLEYVLIGEGWALQGNRVPDLLKVAPAVDVPRVLARAKEKKVGIWLWTHWRSVEAQMTLAFPQFEKWGVRGIMVDQIERDDQDVIAFYRQVAAEAAEYHLMVDFHGSTKPDGLRRTFPNVLTQEGVLGSEYSKWGARVTPEHNVTLAFTRMLAGAMDYAPGGFANATREQFEPREERPMTLGTRAHQLALFVVFESPLQRLPDSPEAYKDQRDFDFIKAVPASWDETRALGGEVGEYVTIARRRGVAWYLGSITNGTARELDVPLTFLGEGTYVADIYADAEDAAANPSHTSITQRRFTSRDSIHLKLAPGGGVAIRLRRAI